jgi:hypothetical protein
MMNYRELNHDESSFLLFAIKKTLRDRQGLTPAMEQFYDSASAILREKLLRLNKCDDSRQNECDI